MISIIKALSKETSRDEMLAISYRLQAPSNLTRERDVAGLSMKLHGRDYDLLNEAAFKTAATCPLSLSGVMGDVQFDRETFVKLALGFLEPEGEG